MLCVCMRAGACARTRVSGFCSTFFPVCVTEMTVGIFILYILLWVYEYMRELLNAPFPSGGATRPYHLPCECMY